MDITNYSKTELTELSKILKKFRNLRKNVGKKSTEILHHELTGTVKILIEYFPALNRREVQEEALKIFKDFFGVDLTIDDIIWKENDILAGGMRIFYGDDMVDLSFESVRNKMSKI